MVADDGIDPELCRKWRQNIEKFNGCQRGFTVVAPQQDDICLHGIQPAREVFSSISV